MNEIVLARVWDRLATEPSAVACTVEWVGRGLHTCATTSIPYPSLPNISFYLLINV